jgi:hypothetical protein
MPAATPQAGGDESPVSNPYTPTEPPRLILVTGTAIDDQTLDNLARTRAFAAVIPLGPKEDDATASVWERIADRRELVPHTPFKLLSLMVNASRGNLESRDDDALAYEALELTRDQPSRLLRALNKGAKDDSGVGVELVFAGLREGDEAYELAAALKTETRHALGQLHYYEH